MTQLSFTLSSLIHKFKFFSLNISELITIKIEAFSNNFVLQVVKLDLMVCGTVRSISSSRIVPEPRLQIFT